MRNPINKAAFPILLSLASACVATLCGQPAALAGDREDCMSAYEQAQDLRKQSQLIEAHGKLLFCVRETCPAVLRKDCVQWIDEVERDTPTVVLSVKGVDGGDAVDVKVFLDGKLVASQLDGKPLSMNPGPHTLRFELQGQPPKEQKVVMAAGTKNRPVSVSFAPTVAPPPTGVPTGGSGAPKEDPAARPHMTTLSWIFGGVGVAGLGAFSAFALMGSSKQSDLDDQKCKPHCAQGDVDSIKTNYLIADISLGVGLIGLGAATYFYLVPPRNSKEASPGSVSVGMSPAKGGGFAVINGSF